MVYVTMVYTNEAKAFQQHVVKWHQSGRVQRDRGDRDRSFSKEIYIHPIELLLKWHPFPF